MVTREFKIKKTILSTIFLSSKQLLAVTTYNETLLYNISDLTLERCIHWGKDFLAKSYLNFSLLVNQEESQFLLLRGVNYYGAKGKLLNAALYNFLENSIETITHKRYGNDMSDIKYIWNNGDLFIFRSMGVPALTIEGTKLIPINSLLVLKKYPDLKILNTRIPYSIKSRFIRMQPAEKVILGGYYKEGDVYTNQRQYEYLFAVRLNEGDIAKYSIEPDMPKKYLVTREVIGKEPDNREDCIIQLYYYDSKMIVLGNRMLWILEQETPTIRFDLNVDGFEVYGVGLSVDSTTGILYIVTETPSFKHFIIEYDLNNIESSLSIH